MCIKKWLRNLIKRITASWFYTTFREVVLGVVYILLYAGIFVTTFYQAFAPNNVNIIIPFDFVTISISLAGFVLIGAFFETTDKVTKKTLYSISKAYIIASIGFIMFYTLFNLLPKGNGIITLDIGIILIIIGFFVGWIMGLFGFCYATTELIRVLGKLGKK